MVVEITPMIDIVFLLIIFFMITAQFARITRAEVELPPERGEQQAAAEEAGLVINVMADGRYVVEQSTYGLEGVTAQVQAAVERAGGNPSRARLMIRPDRRADTAALNALLTRLRELGVPLARVATEVPR